MCLLLSFVWCFSFSPNSNIKEPMWISRKKIILQDDNHIAKNPRSRYSSGPCFSTRQHTIFADSMECKQAYGDIRIQHTFYMHTPIYIKSKNVEWLSCGYCVVFSARVPYTRRAIRKHIIPGMTDGIEMGSKNGQAGDIIKTFAICLRKGIKSDFCQRSSFRWSDSSSLSRFDHRTNNDNSRPADEQSLISLKHSPTKQPSPSQISCSKIPSSCHVRKSLRRICK
jgi:hypothetical protein